MAILINQSINVEFPGMILYVNKLAEAKSVPRLGYSLEEKELSLISFPECISI